MRRLLFGYQMLVGLSDASTGLLLIFKPALTMRLMGLQPAPDTLPFLSFIGAFVLSVGIACFYGASLASAPKLEAVWLLTALTRGLVATFVAASILSGAMEPGWAKVGITDAALALVQAIGLQKGWLRDALA